MNIPKCDVNNLYAYKHTKCGVNNLWLFTLDFKNIHWKYVFIFFWKNGARPSRFINLNQDYLGPKSKDTTRAPRVGTEPATQRITVIRAPHSTTSGTICI